MVKLGKHMKKLTAAALAGMVALALFTPGVLAESDADSEPSLFASDESAAEAVYSVKLAAWADGVTPDDTDSSLYHVGKSFYVDLVVSGGPFSGFQGNVVYDSDKLIYDDSSTQEYVESINDNNNNVTVKAGGDGIVSVIRTGKVTADSSTVITRVYFTAKKDKKAEITMSDVKVGTDISDSSAAALSEDRIAPCVVDVTKSYMMTDIALGTGANVDATGDGFNIDINGKFAVDVISMGRDIDCAELTVAYDADKLKLDKEKTEEGLAQGCNIAEISAGKIKIIRNSDGMKAGSSVARLWFDAVAAGNASVDITEAKAGSADAQSSYAAEDLSGCTIKVNPDGVAVNVTSYLGDGAELSGITAGENIIKGEFTFTVKAASTPVAAITTDNGTTYTKLAAASADGVYSFTATAAEGMRLEIALLGDVDHNGVIDADDVTKLARHIAKIELITDEFSLVTSDVDNNNELTAEDVTKIARHIAKIESI